MKEVCENHSDFSEGYRDGHDKECPEPSDNRSERYKHSFWVARNELNGKVGRAAQNRINAEKASCKDDSCGQWRKKESE